MKLLVFPLAWPLTHDTGFWYSSCTTRFGSVVDIIISTYFLMTWRQHLRNFLKFLSNCNAGLTWSRAALLAQVASGCFASFAYQLVIFRLYLRQNELLITTLIFSKDWALSYMRSPWLFSICVTCKINRLEVEAYKSGLEVYLLRFNWQPVLIKVLP